MSLYRCKSCDGDVIMREVEGHARTSFRHVDEVDCPAMVHRPATGTKPLDILGTDAVYAVPAVPATDTTEVCVNCDGPLDHTEYRMGRHRHPACCIRHLQAEVTKIDADQKGPWKPRTDDEYYAEHLFAKRLYFRSLDLEKEVRAARNLLARIHRDGGHHRERHGLDSYRAADDIVVGWLLRYTE